MSVGEKWSADPDMSSRDPNNINDHLQVSVLFYRTNYIGPIYY